MAKKENIVNLGKHAENTSDKEFALLYQDLFNALDEESNGYIFKRHLLGALKDNGIVETDKRIEGTMGELDALSDAEPIDLKKFRKITQCNISLIEKAIRGQLVIPDFKSFTKEIRSIYTKVQKNDEGEVADYIPQLARVNPDHYAISICTIDGQRFSLGDHSVPFCIQSVCKPINYCLALELAGENTVHGHVGREPSGRSFNEITLNDKHLPHNPMINAGAIMSSSLIQPGLSMADRFDLVMNTWQSLAGNCRPGFNNSVYHSEKETADRNFALAHFMKEMNAFPENVNLVETLEFYFQCCSIEVNSQNLACVAAALANAGACPATGDKIFSSDTVKNCLSLMYSCGMYDFSGEYAFTVGVPAKSGVSGALMIVIPNVMGIAIWSPRLDVLGNSVRGVEFSKELVRRFNFHNYDSLVIRSEKQDPRNTQIHQEVNMTFTLVSAASRGDLNEVKRLVACGVDLNKGDYDGRTALHLAAAEGHLEVVKYLINKGVDVNFKDRWNNSPIADAKRGKYKEVVRYLERSAKKGVRVKETA